MLKFLSAFTFGILLSFSARAQVNPDLFIDLTENGQLNSTKLIIDNFEVIQSPDSEYKYVSVDLSPNLPRDAWSGVVGINFLILGNGKELLFCQNLFLWEFGNNPKYKVKREMVYLEPGVRYQVQVWGNAGGGCGYPGSSVYNIPRVYIYSNILNTSYESPGPTPSLSIVRNSVSASPSSGTADGHFSVEPEQSIIYSVAVAGSNIQPTDSRSVIVRVQIGNRPPEDKYISLQSLRSGIASVSFKETMNINEVGQVPITVEVNPDRAIKETIYSDNYEESQFFVLCQGKEVQSWLQGENPWGSDLYDHLTVKMSKSGCYTTSAAMQLSSYGLPINPKILNDGLKKIKDGYTKTGALNPEGVIGLSRTIHTNLCIANGGPIAICQQEAKKKYKFTRKVDFMDELAKYTLNQRLCQKKPTILAVPSISNPANLKAFHFVLATGMTVTRDGEFAYKTNDPALDKDYPRKLEEIRGLRIYDTAEPSFSAQRSLASTFIEEDESSIAIYLGGNLHMVVTDPEGNRVGYDPKLNTHYEEVEDSQYSFPEAIASSDDDSHTIPESSIRIEHPLEGSYSIRIIGDQNQSSNYTISKMSYASSGDLGLVSELSGTIGVNQNKVIAVPHKNTNEPNVASLRAQQALYYDTTHRDRAFIRGKIDLKGLRVNQINDSLSINIGGLLFNLKSKQINKVKIGKDLHFIHLDWGKNGVSFGLNGNSGEFYIYVPNSAPKDSRIPSNTFLRIQIDGFIAEGTVQFKDIKGKNHDKKYHHKCKSRHKHSHGRR